MAGNARESLRDRAIDTAVAVARQHGLRVDEPLLLRDGSNTLVQLRPAPVVARVATGTAAVRRGDAWLAREVAVGMHLAAAGAPVVPPSSALPPGPHSQDGLALSFWQLCEERGAPADPHATGRTLRETHEALAGFASDLPLLAAPDEARRLLDDLLVQDAFDRADARALERMGDRSRGAIAQLGLPVQALHGDAHLGNVLATPAGPLWNDFEDTFRGPIVWDLACIVAPFRIGGLDPAPANHALQAHGALVDAETLDLFVDLRAVQIVVWTAVLGRTRPASRERLAARVAWLRKRDLHVHGR